MANFEQAVKWMKEGKKVRRSFWDKSARYYSKSVCGNDKRIKGEGNITSEYSAYFDIDDFESHDWEIYCEKQTCNKCTRDFEGDYCSCEKDPLINEQVSNQEKMIKILSDIRNKLDKLGSLKYMSQW